MTPVQRQLHEQLQRKARQVQDAILRQQEELREIAQQLAFSQGVLPIMNGPNVAGKWTNVICLFNPFPNVSEHELSLSCR